MTRVPVTVEGKEKLTQKLTISQLKSIFQDYISSDMGARGVRSTPIKLGGRDAIAVEADGTGNGLMANPRLGGQQTHIKWVGTALSPTLVLRVQFGAPAELFDALRPDFDLALQSVQFGPVAIPSQPLTSQVSDERLRQALVGATPPSSTVPTMTNPALAATPTANIAPTVPSTPEVSYLSADQWQALDKAAKAKGLSLGALLRQIVDEFLKTQAMNAGNK